jgi:hypothetical protein
MRMLMIGVNLQKIWYASHIIINKLEIYVHPLKMKNYMKSFFL